MKASYAAFLNAVAATDTYALYHVNRWTHADGCKIERTGSPGSYTYSVAPDWAILSGIASAVDLGPLTCIENDSDDESNQSHPDMEMPALNTAFIYLVRFQEGPVIGPWGFGSAGEGRTGIGGCAP